MEVVDDGVRFDVASLDAGPIREDQDYGGVRLTLRAEIGSALVRLQVDVGFGDAITPGPELIEFPPLLDFDAPKMRAYPRPTVVAEKLEAMVKLGIANSRMKDFFDVVVMARMFSFDGIQLVRAIRATFERRGTALPKALPLALTDEFALDATKSTQWAGFVRKSGASTEVGDLPEVVRAARGFLADPLAACHPSETWAAEWKPGGPWKRS